MKTLNPNNRNPKNGIEFWTVHKLLIEEGNGVATTNTSVGVGNNTTARFRMVGHDDPAAIEIVFYETVIAVIYEDHRVKINTGGFKSNSTRQRINWCLLPLGFKMVHVYRTPKVYSVNTGAYKDFRDGMVVEKGEF